jgi:hypothetical protein
MAMSVFQFCSPGVGGSRRAADLRAVVEVAPCAALVRSLFFFGNPARGKKSLLHTCGFYTRFWISETRARNKIRPALP